MIDLHTHTLFSDGELGPAELVLRCQAAGYRAVALTDHVDSSNWDLITPKIARFCKEWKNRSINPVPGAEITHEPPERIGELVKKCRDAGAKIVVVHGETIVEPVAPGTNKAAIEAGTDILAHPGLISDQDVQLAVKNRVSLEISGRAGHSFANGHVALMARKYGASLVFSTDAHAPRDLMNREMAAKVSYGAGMTDAEIDSMFENAMNIVEQTK